MGSLAGSPGWSGTLLLGNYRPALQAVKLWKPNLMMSWLNAERRVVEINKLSFLVSWMKVHWFGLCKT